MASSIPKLPSLFPGRYTVAWLCALPEVELEPAIRMLDYEHERPVQWLNDQDENYYYYGDLNGHNVVIAPMPVDKPGKISASLLVKPLQRSFPNLRLYLFVGIGGGVPRSPSPSNAIEDIRLGDVVIGWAEAGVPAIVEYDYARYIDKSQTELLGSVDNPQRILINHLTPFLYNIVLGDRPGFKRNLDRLVDERGYQHPGLQNDMLFAAKHKHTKVAWENDPICEACDASQQVQRSPRSTDKAIFHRGTILSGDLVMMNAEDRDILSRKYYNAKVFEMEAAGIMADTHGLIIRGVSDYADSHKASKWRKYAAATAAAFAREFLCEIRATAINDLPNHQNILVPQSNSQSSSTSQAQTDIQDSLDDGERRLLEAPQSATADYQYYLYDKANQLWKPRRESPANLLQTLQEVLTLLERATKHLKCPGISDPKVRVKVYFRLIQVEREITFECRKGEEQDHHVERSVAYGNEALQAAKETHDAVVVAHVELEIAFSKGREALLWAERHGRDDRGVKLARQDAVQQINAALWKMRSRKDLYEKNKKHADEYWLERLSD
ncbi:MAG: hypothetical protein Q9226_008628 [Calogaya cf. arnoldii]